MLQKASWGPFRASWGGSWCHLGASRGSLGVSWRGTATNPEKEADLVHDAAEGPNVLENAALDNTSDATNAHGDDDVGYVTNTLEDDFGGNTLEPDDDIGYGNNTLEDDYGLNNLEPDVGVDPTQPIEK